MSSLPRLVIVGGSGRVALRFSQIASNHYSITSLVCSKDHFDAIAKTGAVPKLLSLEDASVDELVGEFDGAQAVLFSAGAGGKEGEERFIKVDQEGAIKVFDAIERLPEPKPYLLLVSALDTRDLSKPAPAHYTEKDLEESKKIQDAISAYYAAKLAADQNLSKRTLFPWTILRPGFLLDESGKGHIGLGVTGMGSVTRDDVAATLLALFRLSPEKRENALGRALDLIQDEDSDVPLEEAVAKVLNTNESSL